MTIRNALILAGALIAFSLAMAWANSAGHIDDETARRATQVAAGLIAVYFANLAPKTLEPLSAGCEPSRVQALQRFSGWALVLGGLGYSLAWLAAPIEHAGTISKVLLGTAVLLVMARLAWVLVTSRRHRRPES